MDQSSVTTTDKYRLNKIDEVDGNVTGESYNIASAAAVGASNRWTSRFNDFDRDTNSVTLTFSDIPDSMYRQGWWVRHSTASNNN